MKIILIKIKSISSKETLIVRHPVLREGKPVDSCRFEGDDLPTTFHLGAFYKDKIVGVVTILKKNNKSFFAKNQFQLRGMAVLQQHQGKGIGAVLVKQSEERVMDLNGSMIWLNARLVALSFYEKLGYKISSDKFEIPLVGVHYTMTKFFNNEF